MAGFNRRRTPNVTRPVASRRQSTIPSAAYVPTIPSAAYVPNIPSAAYVPTIPSAAYVPTQQVEQYGTGYNMAGFANDAELHGFGLGGAGHPELPLFFEGYPEMGPTYHPPPPPAATPAYHGYYPHPPPFTSNSTAAAPDHNPFASGATAATRTIPGSPSPDSFDFVDPALDDAAFDAEADKRQRNNAASARYRARKKVRDVAQEHDTGSLRARAAALESRVAELATEGQWLRALVVERDGPERLERATREYEANKANKGRGRGRGRG